MSTHPRPEPPKATQPQGTPGEDPSSSARKTSGKINWAELSDDDTSPEDRKKDSKPDSGSPGPIAKPSHDEFLANLSASPPFVQFIALEKDVLAGIEKLPEGQVYLHVCRLPQNLRKGDIFRHFRDFEVLDVYTLKNQPNRFDIILPSKESAKFLIENAPKLCQGRVYNIMLSYRNERAQQQQGGWNQQHQHQQGQHHYQERREQQQQQYQPRPRPQEPPITRAKPTEKAAEAPVKGPEPAQQVAQYVAKPLQAPETAPLKNDQVIKVDQVKQDTAPARPAEQVEEIKTRETGGQANYYEGKGERQYHPRKYDQDRGPYQKPYKQRNQYYEQRDERPYEKQGGGYQQRQSNNYEQRPYKPKGQRYGGKKQEAEPEAPIETKPVEHSAKPKVQRERVNIFGVLKGANDDEEDN